MFMCDDASLWQYVALGWVRTAMLGRVHAQFPEGVSRELPRPALTLWTVSLGVDHGSGSGKHGTAGPWDRSSHLLGKSGRRGKGAASAQAGASWGAPPPLRQDWETPALGPGHLDPKCPS